MFESQPQSAKAGPIEITLGQEETIAVQELHISEEPIRVLEGLMIRYDHYA